jgi:hypothetical protein
MIRYALLFAASVVLPDTSLGQSARGEKLKDGSVAYRSDFGMVLSKPDGTIILALPNSETMVSLKLKGFSLSEVQSKREGVMFATETINHFLVSAYFEKVSSAGSANGCRNHYFEYALKSPTEKTGIKRYKRGDLSIGSYLIGKAGKVELNQRHWNIYAHTGNYCLDAHVSKVLYDAAKDEAILEAIADSIAILPKK